MRLIYLVLTGILLLAAPVAGQAAGDGVTVRAIAFIASNDRGATDARLAPYEGILRSNLRFESFKFAGESSTSVSAGGKASISVSGGRVEVQCDAGGTVTVRRGGTVVTVSPGRPAVFMSGPANRNGASGVIVMVD